jgi:hypothetical protein
LINRSMKWKFKKQIKHLPDVNMNMKYENEI